jgi:hypothetical protein
MSYASPITPTLSPTSPSNPTWINYGSADYSPQRRVIGDDVVSPSKYTIPSAAVYTSVSIPSSSSTSVGYPISSAPPTPRQAIVSPPHRLAGALSPSGISPRGPRTPRATTIPYHVSTGSRAPPTSSTPVVVMPPPASPAAGSDYVAELGRAAWKLLHAVAEQYPPVPTYDDQQSALQFIYTFAKMYPCLKCRIHFQRVLQELPPNVSSQPAFVAWMSAFHDRVNADLRKPQQ